VPSRGEFSAVDGQTPEKAKVWSRLVPDHGLLIDPTTETMLDSAVDIMCEIVVYSSTHDSYVLLKLLREHVTNLTVTVCR